MRRRASLLLVAALTLSAGTAGLLTATSTPARANPACYAQNGHLYCGNNAPTPIYARSTYGHEDPAGGFRPTPIVDTLRTNPSYFQCWIHGARHSGGNDIWYYTNGDDTGQYGYVPAVEVFTPTDPFPGVNAC